MQDFKLNGLEEDEYRLIVEKMIHAPAVKDLSKKQKNTVMDISTLIKSKKLSLNEILEIYKFLVMRHVEFSVKYNIQQNKLKNDAQYK